MDNTLFEDLAELIPEIPADSIISKTIFDDDLTKAVLFGFAPGQALSEHTASMPAILHFIEGESQLSLNDEMREAKPGTWVHMPAHMPHSVTAKTSVIMLLLLMKGR